MLLRTAHVSLQFGDSDAQHEHDMTKIFKRAVDRHQAWVTGTEAGPGSGNTGDLLVDIAKDSDYIPWVPSEQSEGNGRSTDCWLAVRKDLVVGDWTPRFKKVIPGSEQLYNEAGLDVKFPRWGPKGIVTVEFQSVPALGDVGLGVAHHLTGGRRENHSTEHGVDHYEWNEVLDNEIAAWMREAGAGRALSFFNMDRNFGDTRNDDQEIGRNTTLADELRRWQNTGHGAIDWMLSHDADTRVTGRSFNVLDDKEFFLNTDHWYCEGTFNVEPLKR